MTTENRDRWLAQLYEENYRRVYRLAVYRLRQGSGRIEEAEDVVQEVFCRAIQHEVWQHENPVGWLIVATNNVCSEMYKEHVRCGKRQEKLSCCDEALLQDPETLAQEMRWDALLKHIGLRFDVSEEWLRTGGGNEPIPTIGKSSVSENDYEYVASIPLMISRSVLLEGVDMIVAIANGGRSGQAVFRAINACLYRMLTDLFLLYCHGMRATGKLDIAAKTSKVMLDAMKQHPLYAEDAFGMDGEH